MKSKKYRHRRFRSNTRKNKARKVKQRRRHRGGGCLNIFPLSTCGSAVGGCDPYPTPYGSTFKQYGGWKLDDVGGRLSASKKRGKISHSKKTKNTHHSAKRNSRRTSKRTSKRYSKRYFRKKRRQHTNMKGGSGRSPILGAELQQGIYTLWNTGEKAVNTWNGRKSPSSLNASPLDQPLIVS
jgi:hypothetical protein